MSEVALFFALAAIELAGLTIIWFRIKSKVRNYLEIENLLDGVREEARALVIELNETADRNVSLVEDRITQLRELLDEVDRRIGVEKRELETRSLEREVYARLAKRRPIVPSAEAQPQAEILRTAPQPTRAPGHPGAASASGEAAAPPHWMSPEADSPSAPRSSPPSQVEARRPEARPRREDEPIPLSLGPAAPEGSPPARAVPEIAVSEEVLFTSKTKREEALDLYRQGISADLIAARLGATVAEIELLVEVEERRAAAEAAATAASAAPGKPGSARREGRY